MEQQRQEMEVEETDFQPPTAPVTCANNCGFFGNSATNNLCSKCFKDTLLSKSKAISVEPRVSGKKTAEEERRDISASSGPAEAKKVANRCGFCNKKVGLMGFKCRCDGVFCSVHRYSEKHNCVFDYKASGQEAIAKANPVVKSDKMEKI